MSLFIRGKAKKCERCGSKENLQDSHIITRSKQPTRWVLDNHQCLCCKCHIYWFHKGSDPIEVAMWVISKIGIDKYITLKILSEVGPMPTDGDIINIINRLSKEKVCQKRKKNQKKK